MMCQTECFKSDCTGLLPHTSWIDHVKENHPENFVPQGSALRSESKESANGDICYLQCYNSLFRGRSWFNSEGGIEFCVWHCNYLSEQLVDEANYKFEVKLLHPQGGRNNKVPLIVEGDCDLYGSYNKISKLDFAKIAPYVVNDTIHFEYTIRKV